jgi:hypothetical protein
MLSPQVCDGAPTLYVQAHKDLIDRPFLRSRCTGLEQSSNLNPFHLLRERSNLLSCLFQDQLHLLWIFLCSHLLNLDHVFCYR